MTATTINSFPSLHSLSSPRGWALAIIVLLHLGFFWVLTNGLSVSIDKVFNPLPPTLIPIIEKPTPPPPRQPTPVEIDTRHPVVTRVPTPLDFPIEEPTQNEPIFSELPRVPGDITGPGSAEPPAPVVVEPRIDARRGLSEPYYPPQMVREGAEGTVVLSIYILADGRVGEVKLVSSSGYAKLDESAMREAKKWRFVPGTSDGRPLAMWKKLPVTFRLNTRM